MSLLSARDRRRLILITVAQLATGFLDLAGVLLIGIVSVVSAAAVSGTPLPAAVQLAMRILDLQDRDPVVLSAWLIAIAAVALITKSALSAVLARVTFRFLANRQAQLSARLTAELLSRPLLAIQARASQDVAFGLTVGTQAATVGILGSASSALADIGLLVVLGIGLTAIDPVVTIFAVVFFGVLAVVMQRLLAGWATRMGNESAQVDIDSYIAIQEAITSYREVMVSDRRGLYVERIQNLRWRSAEIGADSQFISLIPKYVFESALIVGALALAVSQVITKDINAAVGIVAVFLVAGSRIAPALLRLQVTSLTIRRSEAPAYRALTLANDLDPKTPSRHSAFDVEAWLQRVASGHPDFEPSISVSGIRLTYPEAAAAAVQEVSFAASPGTSVAFVGPTGAGKSTLADALLGVVAVDQGSVLIGGLPPAQAIARWPGGIAYVPQEVALVNATVRENVALGLPVNEIDDIAVWSALERAHLASFMRENREGLDTLIGENGMKLSGGQRQRLGVARALFTRPRLLVLDEATSALDAETEEAISVMMRELEGDVTTVTIAHRLATIRHCDLILYLEDGLVMARGKFDDVRSQSAAFDRQAQLLGL